MRLALPIDGEAMISLGAKSVHQAHWMLSALDYGNVRNVSHLGKHRDRLPIQGDSEVKMRGNQLLVSWTCLVVGR